MSTYIYAGVPLTPRVFSDVAAEVVEPGAVVSRKDLIERVSKRHDEGGGLPSRSALPLVAKKALSDMQTRGRAQSADVPGYWRFPPATTPESGGPMEVGQGGEVVYAYYFPAYRDQAAQLGREFWPMKIGMTTSDHTLRVRDQCGTAMPERPMIGLVYRTDDARNAERLLHSTLRARGRHMSEAPGTEWFLTSLAEVRTILDFVAGQD